MTHASYTCMSIYFTRVSWSYVKMGLYLLICSWHKVGQEKCQHHSSDLWFSFSDGYIYAIQCFFNFNKCIHVPNTVFPIYISIYKGESGFVNLTKNLGALL